MNSSTYLFTNQFLEVVLCDDTFFAYKWTLAGNGTTTGEIAREKQLGSNNLAAGTETVMIPWYTEISFERTCTDVNDQTAFGSTVNFFEFML